MNKRILARQRKHRERSEDLRSEYCGGSRGAGGQLVTDAGAGSRGAREPHVGGEQGEHRALGSAIASLLTTGGPGHLIRL